MSAAHDAHADASAGHHDAHDHFDNEPATELGADDPRTPNWVPFLGLALFFLAGVAWLVSSDGDKPGTDKPAAAANAAAVADPQALPRPPTVPVVPVPNAQPGTPQVPNALKQLTPEQAQQIQQRIEAMKAQQAQQGQQPPGGQRQPGQPPAEDRARPVPVQPAPQGNPAHL